jgi:hypothetical protein
VEEKERSNNTAAAFKIRCFRSGDPNDNVRHRTLLLNRFSQAAIKDILRQHVQGFNPGRAIAYLPNSSSGNNYELVLTEDLYHELHDSSEADREIMLDEKASRIKASSAIVMIHEYTV